MLEIVLRRVGWIMMLSLLGIFAAGCAKTTVTPTMRAAGPLPQPDMIIVNDFAVSHAEVKLDRGLMATAFRDAGQRSLTEEENRVGHMVAEKLSQSLVEELRKAGITAARGSDIVQPSSTTVILHGQFVTIDEGDQTQRVWIGFGLGGSQLRTNLQATQGGQLVVEAETATKSNLKPGMLVSLGSAAAAESAAAIAVGAGTTGVSEAFLQTVQADATRTAKEIAKRIKRAYRERGWLP